MMAPSENAKLWPLTRACAANGIGKTRAFSLAASGQLDTVMIGGRRYVVMASLNTLAERLQIRSMRRERGAR